MSDADRYKFRVTCSCGAEFSSAKYMAIEVDAAVHMFNADHEQCRAVVDFEARIHDLELMTGLIPGMKVVIEPDTKVV